MNLKMFRAKKSEWLLWIFYFLAYFTIIAYAIILLRFVAQAFLKVYQYGVGQELGKVLFATFKMLGVTYLWVLPWAFLIIIFYFMDEHDWKREWGRSFVRVYLRIPPVALGVMVLFVTLDFSKTLVMSLIVGLIALPRILFGWIGIIKELPLTIRDAGLSIGMTRLQLIRYLYLRKEGKKLFYHLLRVTCLLLGTVAPFVYLTSHLGFSGEPMNYLSLEAFIEIVKGHDGPPIIWSSLLLLLFLTFLLTPDGKEKRWAYD